MAKYTKSLVQEVISSILAGKTIKTALKELDKPVSFQTWSNWLAKDPELLNRYHQAKVSSLDLQLAEIKDELDKLCEDAKDVKGVSIARVNAMKLKQGQIQFELSKLLPKQWGNQQQISLNNSEKEPIVIQWKS